MKTIREELFKLKDNEYRDFQCRLTPNIDRERVIGVRVPEVRKLAKKYYGTIEADNFIKNLPHKYYDENMFHGLIISEIKEYDLCIKEINRFLPCVDNWAVCDIMSPKIFKKNKDKLIVDIKKWCQSSNTFECRFGIEMLMSHYLDDNFNVNYLNIPASINSDEYYVKMMIAWFFATALAKKWDETIPYIENSKLSVWVHNKTIQKACESYRITNKQKEYLKKLKK